MLVGGPQQPHHSIHVYILVGPKILRKNLFRFLVQHHGAGFRQLSDAIDVNVRHVDGEIEPGQEYPIADISAITTTVPAVPRRGLEPLDEVIQERLGVALPAASGAIIDR